MNPDHGRLRSAVRVYRTARRHDWSRRNAFRNARSWFGFLAALRKSRR